MKKIKAMDLFTNILSMDTSNCNEEVAINYIHSILLDHDIESEVVESPNGRSNLIAKIKGNDRNPSLILLSHMDVVPAFSEDWTYGPFEGRIEEGCIWGRGTLDTKQLTVMHLIAFLKLKELESLNRDVFFIVTADEESGSKEGMEFLAKKYFHIFKGSTVLSEGGGFTVKDQDNNTSILFASAEKGTAKVRIHGEGPGGHAASPPTNTASGDIIDSLEKILKSTANKQDDIISNRFTQFIKVDDYSSSASEDHKLVKQLQEYMSQMTFSIENFEIGDSINVIPSRGFVDIQFRTLPDMNRESLLSFIESIFTDKKSWELLDFQKGYISNPDHELISLFKKNGQELSFDSEWVPFTALGRTDGRFLSEYADNIYGISPVYTPFREVLKRVHNINERIEIDSFEFGVEVMKRTVCDYCRI
ncbi:M20/M25/M40 family metallo-hydrolase [Evansella sp. AB-rgal1]|uniref:M20/M25/M40 family metallo-hydrolase n=1 Tax=Evansella sp. AB-rgal1 TaxID=3242696 RepID=UPI00359EE256